MRITISGPPGSGKSTACKLLSEKLGLEVISSGDVFRGMAAERGLSLQEFGKACESDRTVDQALDDRMLVIARQKKDVILEGRLTAFMLKANNVPALKVLLTAGADVRAARVTNREGGEVALRKLETLTREACEARRYMSYYNINIADQSVYDLIIDTSDLTPDEVVSRIVQAAGARHG